jgi:hypothetical protein
MHAIVVFGDSPITLANSRIVEIAQTIANADRPGL